MRGYLKGITYEDKAMLSRTHSGLGCSLAQGYPVFYISWYRWRTFVRKVIGRLFVLWMAIGSITAQGMTFGEATAAYERGDYATALAGYGLLAKEGSSRAQHNIGVMYDEGEGVPENRVEAVK
ncbi:MAG: TPR repeat protein [Gammaproteobacteria bacterium]|jgi:TPR repeat protein